MCQFLNPYIKTVGEKPVILKIYAFKIVNNPLYQAFYSHIHANIVALLPFAIL